LQRKLSKESDDSLVAELKAKGTQVDAVNKAAFQQATASVVTKWEGSPIGPFVKKVVAASRAQ
jgi:TRAP-type C4-dicarboxylate transport system substrate-binding protein